MQGTARPRICALLTSFNRRAKTLECLAALEANRQTVAAEVHAVLVDDGSADGTAAEVRTRFSWVQVIDAEGDLYWCRGMHRAFERACAQRHDHYLWLNDDTVLEPDALSRLLACQADLARNPATPVIVVGSTRNAAGGLTYGGERRVSRWRPTRFAKVAPQPAAQPVDTFDGNIVLISQAAAARVGNLDPTFEHAMGDFDYGLRASKLGIELWLAPGWHGFCDGNPVTGTFQDPDLPWRRRWRLMMARKGLPPRSWWHFNRRHSGLLGPLAFAWPYLRTLMLRSKTATKRTPARPAP
jgi:GT2 family glycosyltransferase